MVLIKQKYNLLLLKKNNYPRYKFLGVPANFQPKNGKFWINLPFFGRKFHHQKSNWLISKCDSFDSVKTKTCEESLPIKIFTWFHLGSQVFPS